MAAYTDIGNLVSAIQDHLEKTGLEGKSLGEFVCITCRHRQTVQDVTMYNPSLFFVLEGTKTLYVDSESRLTPAGNVVCISGDITPAVVNEPNPATNRYCALGISLSDSLNQKLLSAADLDSRDLKQPETSRTLSIDPELTDALRHFLETVLNNRLTSSDMRQRHKIIEIVLIILNRYPEFLTCLLPRESWTKKVRHVLTEDLSQKWDLKKICRRLHIAESTLYRNLKAENTGFRMILDDMRMTKALTMVQSSRIFVTEIAAECGYESLPRFIDRFHRRFGISPAKLRRTM